ncbi:MAG TPA: FAD-dependent oxidoreductase [Clostridiaceae bacterium]|nr:FAD-dependent oxidoreductase [Clostridiaceae bacterium]
MLELHLNLTPENETEIQGPVTPDPRRTYDTLIVGAGPAGLNAALYLKRKGRDVAVFGDKVGGQMLNTSSVENYIGTGQNSGYDLSQQFSRDVERMGIPVLSGYRIESWRMSDDGFALTADNKTVYKGRTVLIATGSNPRHLNIPGESAFADKGVSYCAICDGPLFGNKRIAVAGGGNAAVEAALDLARIAKELTVVQRSQFRADEVLLNELRAMDNVTLLTETRMEAIEGDEHVEGIRVFSKQDNEMRYLPLDAVFIEIGHDPNVGPFAGDVLTNDRGEIIIDEHNRTNIPGMYAAGDVAETMYKQIVIAAADGAKAALSINNDLTAGKPLAAYQNERI